LHDAIEDQGGAVTREEIRQRFGEQVTAIVDGCTDSEIIPKLPWLQRKERYIAHISSADTSVLLVSVADKLYNAQSILKDYLLVGEDIWERFQGKKAGTLWYYRSLVTAFNQAEVNESIRFLVAELAQVVSTIEILAQDRKPSMEEYERTR
jgi:GTP pyrophosphokinase